MNKAITMLCTTILLSSTAWAEDTLTFLHGTWAGKGTTSGMAAEIRQTWIPALNDRFTSLRLHNRMTLEDGTSFVFEGNGYYQKSELASLTGVWIDSEGNILPLVATLEHHSLVVVWGRSDTKLGKSTYRLLADGTLETSDFVANDEGEWKKFGHAILKRELATE